MTELAVVTPCFSGDAHLFPYLHRSVLAFTPETTVHHVLVPRADVSHFRQYEGPRCRVWNRSAMLPMRYVRLPRSGLSVNILHPWPPLRGWVMQQTAKIAATAELDAEVVVVVDSDAVLVRPVRADRFRVGDRLCLYRTENGVTANMRRHVIWHHVARKLLGLPPPPPPPLPDYVTPVNVWEPSIVRAMQERITSATGQNWLNVFNAQRHVSEFILYGVFAEEVLFAGSTPPPTDNSIVHNYYSHTPLTDSTAADFVDRLPRDAIAMMISAKSGTPMDVRLAALERCTEVAGAS